MNGNRCTWMTGMTVAGLLMVVVGCDQHSEPETPPQPVAQAAPGTSKDVATGQPAQASFGAHLIDRAGQVVSTDALQGRTIGLYFSAAWCPPCRTFTPKLVEAYNELKAADKPFELVFVSSDRTEAAMMDYMKNYHMEWLAVPFSDPARSGLAERHRIRGIPSLVIVNDAGQVISTRGVQEISSHGAAAFDQW